MSLVDELFEKLAKESVERAVREMFKWNNHDLSQVVREEATRMFREDLEIKQLLRDRIAKAIEGITVDKR